MVGSYLGARLAGLPFVTDAFQLVAFGAVMVIASVLMILKKETGKKSSSNRQRTGLMLTWEEFRPG